MTFENPGLRQIVEQITIAALLTCTPAWAASVSGTVRYPDGRPGSGARVILVELVRDAFTDDEGRFRFEEVPDGEYHLQASAPGLGSAVEEITVAGDDLTIDLLLGISEHRERIVVTATRSGRGSGEVIQPVEVLDETVIDDLMQPTLGETLSQQSGVSSTYYGPGTSRPIIRGKGGGRVRVMEGGLGVGDASTTSPDHAVALDPFSAERIEILRGSATLLYGSAAVGGVVNVIDKRIPEYAPDRKFEGEVRLRAGSASEERAGSLELGGGVKQFAWHLAALGRETDDFDIPGNAVRNDPDSADGTLPNSSIESEGATLGLSWVGDKGFVGASGRVFDSAYGIPVIFQEAGEDVLVAIDMEQTRFDLRGGFDIDWGRFTGVRFTAGHSDYEHAEIEVEENRVGTRFFNEAFEGRLELFHGERSVFPGVIGLQLATRDARSEGLEAFIPPSETGLGAIFAMQEFHSGKSMRYEVGLRYERQDLAAESVCSDGTPCRTDADCAFLPPGENECRLNRDREFDLFSVSGGLAWSPNETYVIAASLSRSERAPTSEELYSEGPHLATASFEVGNPSLDSEVAHGLEISFRKRSGRIEGEINLYAQDYSDFIFESPTGEIEDDLPVFEFAQADARFFGAELNLLIELFHGPGHDLDLQLFGDSVGTENDETDEALPYIPPSRAGLGLAYKGTRWSASLRGTYVGRKNRVSRSAFDVASFTDSYTMIDANVGYRFLTGRLVHQIVLRAKNLTDEEARVNSSRLRDLVPLPGRDLNLSYRLVF